MWQFAVALTLLVVGSATSLRGQTSIPTIPPVSVGLGLDTSVALASHLLQLWRRYLQSGPYDGHRTSLWSSDEQHRWPDGFDLTTPWCYGSKEDYSHAQATVLDIAPIRFDDSSAYAIRTLFQYQDSTMPKPLPVAVCRVYGVREGSRWVLTNALGPLTRDWKRTRLGPITFIYPISHRFDPERARRSVAFVDSLSTVFAVHSLKPIDFYVAESPEEMLRLLGLDVLPNHFSGLAFTSHRLIFSGAQVYGEWYPHELAHMVVDSLTKAWRTPFALDEGLAMWLGGSRGKDFPALMQGLAKALAGQPSLTLDGLLGSASVSDTLAYPAAAALLQIAYERGRMPEVRTFLGARLPGEVPDTILDMAQRTFHESRERLAAIWRSRVLQYDRAATQPRKGA
jgi:hypothetical protein